MSAPHKNVTYEPIKLPNPFADSSDRAYAEILEDKMKEAKLWRMSAFVNLLLFFISLILFFVSMNQQKTVPVLINVMPSGEAQYLGEVRQSGNVQVSEASVHFWINSFVYKYRTVSTDYQVVFKNIDELFTMITNNYTPILRQSLLDDYPGNLVGKVRRSVEIESILLITGRSYAVNWTETSIDAYAAQTAVKMRAVVTVRLVNPTDATIKQNPLGIYIENFEMTEL